ncbi:MAG: hypothetical protein ACYDA4_14280 [Ignavibacteriaceae bacterium]
MRQEFDSIGTLLLPDDEVDGIHAFRALDNFPMTNERVNLHLKKIPFITALRGKRILNHQELLEFLSRQTGAKNEQRF